MILGAVRNLNTSNKRLIKGITRNVNNTALEGVNEYDSNVDKRRTKTIDLRSFIAAEGPRDNKARAANNLDADIAYFGDNIVDDEG